MVKTLLLKDNPQVSPVNTGYISETERLWAVIYRLRYSPVANDGKISESTETTMFFELCLKPPFSGLKNAMLIQ